MKRILYTLIFITLPVAIAAQFRQDTISNDSIEPLSLRSSATTSSLTAEMPVIIPKTPEVQGLERYGEYPVSQYTGTMSVDIPLHTVKVNGFEFPVSLNYHATGIQVTQEATWVGLGWNLLAGGCITTIAVGKTDLPYERDPANDWNMIMQYFPTYFPSDHPRRFKEQGERLWGGCEKIPDPNPLYTTDAILYESLSASGERDIFNASFLNHNFRFSIHPVSKKIVFNGEKGNFIIKKERDSPFMADKWTIIDDSGYEYIFTDKETYKTHDDNTPILTWYLSEIRRQGKKLISFKYNSAGSISYLPVISDTKYYDRYTTTVNPWPERSGNTIIRRTGIMSDYNTQLYLACIVSHSDSIVFQLKDRVDIRNAKALDKMIVFDNITKQKIKEYDFIHDYFTGSSVGATWTNKEYVIKRLKLNKIQRTVDGKKETYSVKYNETISLPYKTSFAQDFWGFYNGKSNNTSITFGEIKVSSDYADLYADNRTLLPDPYSLYEEHDFPGFQYYHSNRGGFFNFRGANRAADRAYISAGVIESITYPTGGKTIYEFEPHTFSNRIYPGMTRYTNDENIVVFNNNSSYMPDQTTSFSVNNEINAHIRVQIRGKDFWEIYPSYVKLTLNADQSNPVEHFFKMQSADMNKYQNGITFIIEADVSLPPGNHTLSTYVPPGIPQQENYTSNYVVSANLTYSTQLPADVNNESIGGGIRVKKITNYTDDNQIASVKSYKYITQNGKTSGKLPFPVRFTNMEYIKAADQIEDLDAGATYMYITRYTLLSNNVYSYTTNVNGNKIGYDRVEIEYTHPENQNNNGREILEFINNPSESYYDDLFFPTNFTLHLLHPYLNGKLIKKSLLNASNDTIRTETYSYNINGWEENFINLHVTDHYIGPIDICVLATGATAFNRFSYNGRFDMTLYPTISYKCVLTDKTESTFVGNNKITQKTTFEYDDTYYSLKKSVLHLENETRETEYKYPYNFNTVEPYKSMVSENILSVPVEETVSKNNQFLEKRIISYKQWGEKQFYPEVIRLQNNSQATPEDRIKFHNYDIYGNPLYITKDNHTKVVYLWGYKGQYPVAEIANATYGDVIGIIGQNAVDYIRERSSEDATVKTLLSTLRNGLPNALVTTYTYRPLVGIKTMTDPHNVKVTYEYDPFNRLQYIKDDSGKIIENYDYHYQNQ